MNKIILSLSLILIFFSCKKATTIVVDEELIQNKSQTEQRNYVRENFKAISQEIAKAMKNPSFKSFVFEKASQKFDDDYNVLEKDLLSYPGISSIANVALINEKLAKFKNIGGNTYYPQLYIPRLSVTNASRTTNNDVETEFVLYDGNESIIEYPGYTLNYDGILVPTYEAITEEYAMSNDVVVMSLNETVDNNGLLTPVTLSTNEIQETQDFTNGKLVYKYNKMTVKHHKESWAAGKSDIAVINWQETWNGTAYGQIGAPLASIYPSTSAHGNSALGYYIKKFDRCDVKNKKELTLERKITEGDFSNTITGNIIYHWTIFERDLWPTGTRVKTVNPFLGNLNVAPTPNEEEYVHLYRSADDAYHQDYRQVYLNKNGTVLNLNLINTTNRTYNGKYLQEHREDNTTIKYNIKGY